MRSTMRPTNQFWSCLMCGSCHFERSSVKYWNWRRILNICLLFCFLPCQKNRMNCCASFKSKSCYLFYSWKWPKMNFTGTAKIKTTEIIEIQHQFEHSTIGPNDMIHTLMHKLLVVKKITPYALNSVQRRRIVQKYGVTSLFEHNQPSVNFCQRNWSLKTLFLINLRWLE